jgi:hypothetical protein
MEVTNFIINLNAVIKPKKTILLIVKLICLLILFYQIILLSIDYLSFPYNVKLDIVDNENHLPAITLCVKSLFNKRKVISHFNLSVKYDLFKQKNNRKEDFEELENNFYSQYFQRLMNNFTEEKINLTLTAKEFIKCSAKLHDSQSFKEITVSDCGEKTQIMESLYREKRIGDKNSGKCFTYFSDINFKRESIVFQSNDFVRFELNKTYLQTKQSSIFVHKPRILNLQYNELLFDNVFYFQDYREYIFRKIEVNFLQWPHENDCHKYSGNFTIFYLFSFWSTGRLRLEARCLNLNKARPFFFSNK